MATGRVGDVIRQFHGAERRDGACATDVQLLHRYLTRRDDAALAALVRRHGPMVWGVCRRVLRSHHDAEDAFQATFLVLVRKAVSITSRELLGNWLYGVAYQTALNARAAAAKRGARERQVAEMPEPEPARPEPDRDLHALLDQELSRLPDKYRVPVVLCDLEGLTRKEAARRLGCPEGTVAGRLARARVMLAKRLARQGVVVFGGALAVALSRAAASAGVPASVVAATVQAAGRLGAGAIPAQVLSLTEGVLRTMLMAKIKAAVTMLAVSAVVGGIGLTSQRLAAGRGENPPLAAVSRSADNPPAPAVPTKKGNAGETPRTFPLNWSGVSQAFVKTDGDKGLRVEAQIPIVGFVKLLDADGQPVTVQRCNPWRPATFTAEFKKVRVFDARGREKAEKEWAKALAADTFVLLDFRDDIDPKKLAEAYQFYRDDLLIVVLPTSVLLKDLDMVAKAMPPVKSLPQFFPGQKPGPGDPTPPPPAVKPDGDR